jgi:hypothetical protein
VNDQIVKDLLIVILFGVYDDDMWECKLAILGMKVMIGILDEKL